MSDKTLPKELLDALNSKEGSLGASPDAQEIAAARRVDGEPPLPTEEAQATALPADTSPEIIAVRELLGPNTKQFLFLLLMKGFKVTPCTLDERLKIKRLMTLSKTQTKQLRKPN